MVMSQQWTSGTARVPLSRYLLVFQKSNGIAEIHIPDGRHKRGLDIIVSFILVIFLAPLLLAIVVAVRLDSKGPAIFRQTRSGLNGRPFKIYKFRTMSVDEDGPTIRQATLGDARITRIGALLRRTSLDELPQLLNVLRGEMSLVGPRPHAAAHDEYYGREIPTYRERFAARPGITGWAQINGARGETPTLAHMQRRVELDLWYLANRSLSVDLLILFKTALAEVTRRTNAY